MTPPLFKETFRKIFRKHGARAIRRRRNLFIRLYDAGIMADPAKHVQEVADKVSKFPYAERKLIERITVFAIDDMLINGTSERKLIERIAVVAIDDTLIKSTSERT